MVIGIITARIGSIFQGAWHKAMVAAVLWILVILTPVAIGLFAICILVFIDLFLGIWKAIKQNNFSSSRLRTGIGKFILYPLAIVSVRISETSLPIDGVCIASDFLILFLSVTELISILETLAILGVDIPSPVLQFFKKQTDIKRFIKK